MKHEFLHLSLRTFFYGKIGTLFQTLEKSAAIAFFFSNLSPVLKYCRLNLRNENQLIAICLREIFTFFAFPYGVRKAGGRSFRTGRKMG